MPDGMGGFGIEAGRQTPAHEQLSRTLWMRKRGDSFRFLLDPAADPGLMLERIDPGAGTVLARVAEAGAQGREVDAGVVLVDGRDGLAFCTTAEPMGFLRRLAAWAGEAIATLPALGLLVDSGAGPLTVDPADAAAAKAYVPEGARVVYNPALWDALLVPDAATAAAALAASPPGERLWYWLAEDEADGVVPLILQPVAWDPNHDRTNWLVDRNTDRGAGEGITGTATICDDGTVQFLGAGLYRDMLEQLARWIRSEHAQHPALRRLADCQLLVASAGIVETIIADPALWEGVPRDPVPGTIGATAAVLEAAAAGGEFWFWITGTPADPPFLHLAPTGDDPDGVRFQAELPALYKRFPKSFDDAISGVATRAAEGKMLFSSHDARLAQFPVQVQCLLDQYGADFPALQALAGASMVQAGADGAPQVVAVAADRP